MWDMELEKNAEFNAKQCKYGHDECRNTGGIGDRIEYIDIL